MAEGSRARFGPSVEPGHQDRVRYLNGGDLADAMIEATGAEEPLRLLQAITRESGTLTVAGWHQREGGDRDTPWGTWNMNGYRLVNAHWREPDEIRDGFRLATRMLARATLDLSNMITNRYPLADLQRAFEDADRRGDGFRKAVVMIGAEG